MHHELILHFLHFHRYPNVGHEVTMEMKHDLSIFLKKTLGWDAFIEIYSVSNKYVSNWRGAHTGIQRASHTQKTRLSVSFHFRQGRHVEIPGSSNSKFWPQKWFCLTWLLRHCWTWAELGDQSVLVPGIKGFRGQLKTRKIHFVPDIMRQSK